jgi:RNA polymerase sigma-70 factor (ECF subfamily)
VQDVEIHWLTAAKSGDSQAFSRLVEAYQNPVYNLCYRMLGDAQEAEDAAQETFIRAYKSMHRYDANRPFSTWILSIAAHFCIDQIRKRHMRTVSFEEIPYQQFSDPSLGPEASVHAREVQEQVKGLLEALSAEDRAAVVMRYWYEFSYEEIASALNMTISAVKSRLHRARKTLAQSWEQSAVGSRTAERTRNESPAI